MNGFYIQTSCLPKPTLSLPSFSYASLGRKVVKASQAGPDSRQHGVTLSEHSTGPMASIQFKSHSLP